MNQENVGKFISELRKENNMTQQELADKLCVTDRAVSHWENGRRLPDISLLKIMSELFNVSITEILNGHRMNIKELENQKELIDKLIDYENYKESEYKTKQAKIIPLYIIGYTTLIIVNRYENTMEEVIIGMLLATSIISNIAALILMLKNIVRHEEIKKKINNK